MKCLWTQLESSLFAIVSPLVLLPVYYWMPEYKGPCILVTGRFFFFIHQSLDICSGMQPPSGEQSWLWHVEESIIVAWRRGEHLKVLNARMPTRMFQGKGTWNTYLCLSWKRYDFPGSQITFYEPHKISEWLYKAVGHSYVCS